MLVNLPELANLLIDPEYVTISLTVGSENFHYLKGELTIISTKDNIRKEALALFAKKGYYGTSMSEIADAVGINKASLYSHYLGKEALFLAVFEDVARLHEMLLEQIFETLNNMEIQNKLCYYFREYILYFYRNQEIFYFSNHSLFHVPIELRKKLRDNYVDREKPFREKLEDIFTEGMEQGIIRKGDPKKWVWSLKIKRDGVLGWMCGSPELMEDCIEESWHDFWFGIIER